LRALGNDSLDSTSPKRRQRVDEQGSRFLPVIAVAPSGLDYVGVVTQGSQSLALGLTLAAATQLAEGSRLVSSSSD